MPCIQGHIKVRTFRLIFIIPIKPDQDDGFLRPIAIVKKVNTKQPSFLGWGLGRCKFKSVPGLPLNHFARGFYGLYALEVGGIVVAGFNESIGVIAFGRKVTRYFLPLCA
jgi:hypothetical protein